MDTQCPECQRSDLLVSLAGVSLRTEDRDSLSIELEGDIVEGGTREVFVFPEECGKCGGPVKETALFEDRVLRCNYCGRRINPITTLEVPRKKTVSEGGKMLGPRDIAETLADTQLRRSGWISLRSYLAVPGRPSDAKALVSVMLGGTLFLLVLGALFSGAYEDFQSLNLVFLFVVATLGLILLAGQPSFRNTRVETNNLANNAYNAGWAILKRSVYCFRDDICYDPLRKATWKPKETRALFKPGPTES